MKRKHTMKRYDDVVYCTTQQEVIKCLDDDRPFRIYELNDLSIYNRMLGFSKMKLLYEALKVNQTITTLDISCNRMLGFSKMKLLSDALKVNQTITTLDISCNEIGDREAKAIVELLEVNRSITTLDISYNEIGDRGAKTITDALKVNRTITMINIRHNTIDVGVRKQFKYVEQKRLELINKIKNRKMLILLEYHAGEHSLFHMLPLEMIHMILNYVVVPRPINIIL